MKKSLRRTEQEAGKNLEILIEQAYRLIKNIKGRCQGGFGVLDGSFPSNYTGFINSVTQWLSEVEAVLTVIYQSTSVVDGFKHISEIPTYGPNASGDGLVEEIKKRISYLEKLMAELQPENEWPENIIFISCGQREEKELGKQITAIVKNLTNYTPYFAENQISLHGLHVNIFERLNKAAGFIVVLHDRGTVKTNDDEFKRASIWIEQEIAIMSFLQYLRKMEIKTLAFIQDGIQTEGLRTLIQLNPIIFKDDNEIIFRLLKELRTWGNGKQILEPIKLIQTLDGKSALETIKFYDALGYDYAWPLLGAKEAKLREGLEVAYSPITGQEIWGGCNPLGNDCQHILMIKPKVLEVENIH